MSFKRYKSVFQESKKVNKKLSLNKESILNRFKRVLREEDLNPSDVEDIVGKIEEVITDVIGDHGVDNPVVDELSSTVKAINMQNRMTSDIDMMESKLNNKFLKLKKESMDMYDTDLDMSDDMDMNDMDMNDMDMDDMYDEPVESFDTGYDMSMEDEDEFMYDADSIMEAEEDDEEDELEEAYDDDEEEDEKEKKEESYKRKRKIAEMKKRLREAEDEDDDEEEKDEMDEAYDDEEDDEMKEEAESDEGDNLIDYDNGSDYDYLSSIDSEGNYSSSRGMDADMDDNRE